MYDILYTGVDSLDIAFQGAFPESTLEHLEAVRKEAEASNRDEPACLGPGAVDVQVKSHGMRGGFRFVFTNGPAGAIFAVKANPDPKEWNLFVSVRALRLLTLGYVGTKLWLRETLAAMGFQITDLSVNRIDFAVDIRAPTFQLDVANFVCPAQAKLRPHWSKEQLLTDDGNACSAVVRGRRFESVTVGQMPNRQLIVYDKRRAAIDLNQPYWFDVWGLDRNDPGARVWRAEIRAGREALAKRLTKRSFEAVEADQNDYLLTAVREIRYLAGKAAHLNVSRAPEHPFWIALTEALANLPPSPEPPLTEARVLQVLRLQRHEMAVKQAYGNLINALLLEGQLPEEIAARFSHYATEAAEAYARDLGPRVLQMKVDKAAARQRFLLPSA